jgi:predicted ATP-dependent endonuclease of OLD family
MLEKVGFKNFLALRDVELTLEPFTVIVGPNASGKSSILEGIKRICNSEEDIFKSLLNLDIKSVKLTPTEDVFEPEDMLSAASD